MFGTIRRHQKWLVPVTFITVICFMFFFKPTGGPGGGGSGDVQLGSVSGEPVSLQDYRQAQGEVFLHYFLSHGEWPDKDTTAKQQGFDAERETYFRLFFISKFKENHIAISPQAVGEQAADILRSMGRNGEVVTPEMFEQQILRARGFTLADFQRYLKNQLSLQQLIAVVGLSGRLVTTEEASSLFQIEQQQISSEAVFFSVSNRLAAVTVTPAALGQFYTNQMAHYRLPERVQVSYVRFNVTNFFADADSQIAKLTNFEQQVDAVYLQRGTNFYSEVKTPAEAKVKIKDEFRRNLALRAARNKAAEFADELMSQSPVTAANLDALATKKGMQISTTAPFDMQNGPVELEVPPTFARIAFKLTSEDPIGGPIPAENGVYLIALKNRLPSEIPAFDSIRDKVQADYRFVQAAQLTYTAGTNFARTLAADLAQGKTFSSLCAEAQLTPVKLSPFSLSSRTLPEIEKHISLGRLQEIAFSLPAGQTSGYVPTEDGGGLILHVTARSAGDTTLIKKEFPAFLARVRQTRQGEAFNAWFSREAERALRDTPLARAKQPKT